MWAATLDPTSLAGAETAAARRMRSFAALIARAGDVLDGGGSAEDVLWELWSGTRWPQHLRERSGRGGQSARLAHRDLDAVCALFETAARSEEVRGNRSVQVFLDTLVAQQIPADTLAEQGVRGESVRLLTAHRAKGLEWDLVVVAHVQAEAWPDLRRRASLLRADELGADGLHAPVSTRELLAEERRLFYVACTRARERLVVTAVRSTDEDGEQPSRFRSELLPEGSEHRVEHRSGRPPRPLSLVGLVAELRRTTADSRVPAPLRAAAARRLARLAHESDERGVAIVPGADPGSWWGTRRRTLADEPVRPGDRPVALSASAVTEISECPARWFLQREAGGSAGTSQAQGFGNVVHAIADGVARGEIPVTLGNVDDLMTEVDRVWGQLAVRTPWSGPREREEVRRALVRFLQWHHRDGARQVIGTETPFETSVSLPDGQQVTLRGRADRVELDADGPVVVVDLKTGKYPPDKTLADNPQLPVPVRGRPRCLRRPR